MRSFNIFNGMASILAGLAAGAALAQSPVPSPSPPQAEARLILLGTSGGPLARPDRAGIATLLNVGGKSYLIDAGEGLVHQLGKAGLQAPAVPLVFFTHLHDDHYVGLSALASFSYTLRAPRLDIYGPLGTADLVKGLTQMLGPSARIRTAEQGFTRGVEAFLFSHDYSAGKIFDDGTVRVLAQVNTHFDLPSNSPAAAYKSYALRFEFERRSIVFTGDTGPSAALAEFAKGADVLVSEMATHADRQAVPPFVRAHMDREHLSPLEVGKLAAAAGVKTLILTHIGVTDASDVDDIRSVFGGKIIVGADMMQLAL